MFGRALAFFRRMIMDLQVDMPTRMRLYTGLVLFAYAFSHFANHALGTISLAAMERGREVFVLFWRSGPASAVLFGAFAVHISLALWKLYQRRSYRMAWWEGAQIGLGLAIPILLAGHVLETSVMHSKFAVEDNYTYEMVLLWPDRALLQSALLLIVWMHGCIGLHYWLRLKAWYRHLAPLALTIAVLTPVLALLGFVSAGREAAALAANPEWLAQFKGAVNWPNAMAMAVVNQLERYIIIGFVSVLVFIAGGRLARWLAERARVPVTVAYPGGLRVAIKPGLTVLEAGRRAGIKHAAVCGGRGRCSTCRVRVGAGLNDLPPPSEDERNVLTRVGAPANVRLACQIRPMSSIEVTPLLDADAGPEEAAARPAYTHGRAQETAVLMAGLMDLEEVTGGREASDTVFLLNRYFLAMERSVREVGGRAERLGGDGVMALFGIEGPSDTGCAGALAAACIMTNALDDLNQAFADDLDRPMTMTIGVHAGPVVIGEVGTPGEVSLSAVGEAVNVAARLRATTRDYDCNLLITKEVGEKAGIDLAGFPSHLRVIGRLRPLTVYAIDDPRQLAAAVLEQAKQSRK